MTIAELINELSKWPSDFEVRVVVDENDFEEASPTATCPSKHVVTSSDIGVLYSLFPVQEGVQEYLPSCVTIETKKCCFKRYDEMSLEETLAWKAKLKAPNE